MKERIEKYIKDLENINQRRERNQVDLSYSKHWEKNGIMKANRIVINDLKKILDEY